MLELLKNNANYCLTQNGAVTLRSSGRSCLDLFFRAGAMRNTSEEDISKAVTRAYAEDGLTALRIVFFARDIRGGLGERRFFRTALSCINELDSKAVKRNMRLIPEYGRWDDLLFLLDTPAAESAAELIRRQLAEDTAGMEQGRPVTLLAKWLPSVNASSSETKKTARRLASLLGMSAGEYRKKLSALRKYLDIIENRLRERDYTFDYSKQPSCAMLRYRKAFMNNDAERYGEYIGSVLEGKSTLNAKTLYPYDIVRKCIEGYVSNEERNVLEASWRSLPSFGSTEENALAVIDTSGSMTWCGNGNVRPIDVAVSLGIYFAEHSKGGFAGHFMSFSERPQLIEIKGRDIFEKVRYCTSFSEVANTNIEASFMLLLNTAVENHLPQEDMPSKLYIISDMEFDCCAEGGNDKTLFREMKRRFACAGYQLPQIVFWNVNSYGNNIPVSVTDTGAVLVSGATPALFDMVMSGETDPVAQMMAVINSERYAPIS